MLPEAFLKRMENQLGAEYPEFLKSLERPRAVALRFNPLKGETPRLPFVHRKIQRWFMFRIRDVLWKTVIFAIFQKKKSKKSRKKRVIYSPDIP